VNEWTQGAEGSDDALVLDNVVWESLCGPHARFATTLGGAAHYPGDVSPFVAVAPHAGESAWVDVATLFGPGGIIVLMGVDLPSPANWTVLREVDAVQMTCTNFVGQPDPDVLHLSSTDVPEMLELVDRTKPGPFLPRTIELGNYFGIRRGGELIAMAGERLHPPGWTEISAVCTDPDYRGQGLGSRLMNTVGAGIVARGEKPLLHAASDNANAIGLYEDLGFTLRRHVSIRVLQIPN
jgi:ribosomal protein S18 acetylase RimI-like enzyme